MTTPYYVNEHQCDMRAIKPGWYGMESNGKLSSGPFSNRGICLTGIVQARSNLRASPGFARAIKCPECENERVRPCTRLDEYGRVWTENSCETCGHNLSAEEIAHRVVN
jgi:ribosomal protein S27E